MSGAEATGVLDLKDKPLPPNGRPGTSGTELGLRANREKASSAFQRAQRAEQQYRAKRRATYAKNDIEKAKEHFKNSWVSFKAGTVYSWHVMRAGPAVISEGARVKMDAQAAEKKKKLEEAIKKAEKATEGETASAETPAA
jgi:Tfp pilus assembly protein PilE